MSSGQMVPVVSTHWRRATYPVLVALILGATVLVRWSYTLRFPANIQLVDIDAQGYHALALNLLDGHGFSLNTDAPFIPDAIRTPLYPLFIAGVYSVLGRLPANVALAQGILEAFTCLAVILIARRLAGDGVAVLAGCLYALNPASIRFSNELLTETALAALVAGMALLVVHSDEPRRWHTLVALGALGGLATLVKPNAALIPIFLAGVVMVERRRAQPHLPPERALLPGFAVAAAVMLVLFPWLLRNRMTFGRWFLSTAFEDNLSHVSAVATLARANGEVVAAWTPRWEEIYAGILLDAQNKFGEDFPYPVRTAREADRFMHLVASVAKEKIAENPADFLVSHTVGFIRGWVPRDHRFWYWAITGDEWEALNTAEGALGQAVAIGRDEGWGRAAEFLWRERFVKLPPLARALWAGWLVSYALGGILFAIGAWRMRTRPAILGLWLIIILYLTFLPGPIAYVRFRIPVTPLIVAAQAIGAGAWVASARARRVV